MKCYYHPDRDAVGQCVDCGKFLCVECTGKYKPVLCDDCYNDRVNNYRIQQEQQIANTKAQEAAYVNEFTKHRNASFIIAAIVAIAITLETCIGYIVEGEYAFVFIFPLVVGLPIFALLFGIIFYLRTRDNWDALYDVISSGGIHPFKGISRYFKYKKIYDEYRSRL